MRTKGAGDFPDGGADKDEVEDVDVDGGGWGRGRGESEEKTKVTLTFKRHDRKIWRDLVGRVLREGDARGKARMESDKGVTGTMG